MCVLSIFVGEDENKGAMKNCGTLTVTISVGVKPLKQKYHATISLITVRNAFLYLHFLVLLLIFQRFGEGSFAPSLAFRHNLMSFYGPPLT